MIHADSERADHPNHPGGFSITDRALELCAFAPGGKILDVGCGAGATVRRLRQMQLSAIGIDADERRVHDRPYLVCARAERTPFSSGTFDGVLMECSLSVIDEPDAALRECHRVLAPGGRLALSDVFAEEKLRLRGCLGRLDTKQDLLALLVVNGFAPELFEDHSHVLRGYFGQMLLNMGAESFAASVGIDIATLKRARCGYCLVIAQKAGT